jgi:hypothetical protein
MVSPVKKGTLSLGRTGLLSCPESEDLERMRAEFVNSGFVRLPGLLAPSILVPIGTAIELNAFDLCVYSDAGAGLYQTRGAGVAELLFISNCPEFLAVIAEIVGVPRVGCFNGKVLRGHSALGGFDEWHYDSAPTRVGALSVNVSSTPYGGGDLELRPIGAQRLERIPNHQVGDAVLFTVAEGYEHRIAPVEHGVRTSFSGWFCTRPDYLDIVRASRC